MIILPANFIVLINTLAKNAKGTILPLYIKNNTRERDNSVFVINYRIFPHRS